MAKKEGNTIEDILRDKVINYQRNTEKLNQIDARDPKIISFYAEKGGVGKTTLCTSIAYTLAAANKRVLIYDCDVQCSLTAWIFGNNLKLEFSNHKNKISSLLSAIDTTIDKTKFSLNLFQQMNSGDTLKPAYAVKVRKNLYLAVGDRQINKLDEQITNTEAITSDAFQNQLGFYSPNNKTGMPYHAIMATARHFKIDFVLLDMNPYPSTLNRCLIMASHYLIIPTRLDFFCQEMVHNMKRNLEEWDKKTSAVIDSTRKGTYKWPDHKPKFLGIITNKFMTYNKFEITDDDLNMDRPDWATVRLKLSDPPTEKRLNEKFWDKTIKEEADRITLELGDGRTIEDGKMAISSHQYNELGLRNILGEITEFYGLGDMSDVLHIPLPFLEEWDFIKHDRDDRFCSVTASEIRRYKKQRNRFRRCLKLIVERIQAIIENDTNSVQIISHIPPQAKKKK